MRDHSLNRSNPFLLQPPAAAACVPSGRRLLPLWPTPPAPPPAASPPASPPAASPPAPPPAPTPPASPSAAAACSPSGRLAASPPTDAACSPSGCAAACFPFGSRRLLPLRPTSPTPPPPPVHRAERGCRGGCSVGPACAPPSAAAHSACSPSAAAACSPSAAAACSPSGRRRLLSPPPPLRSLELAQESMGMDLGEIGREAAVPKRPFEVWEGAREGISVAFAGMDKLKAVQLTETHSLENPLEYQKLLADHPNESSVVMGNRIKGKLKVTRAFGVGYLKQKKFNDALMGILRVRNLHSPPYVYTNPHTVSHKVTEDDLFVVLGSDGLFDFFSNDEVVQLVYQFMHDNPIGDPAKYLIEQLLLKAAKEAGIVRNILLVLYFIIKI
ncbi:hypothetical protein E2562_035707 [Oryza meyeriana var. granulata]|uniref:protein-serine/threonine phosphatase n=1 Tax=Oryza meyeriana var. granulata TaxID=110450 RepID=A0A6G1C3P8_9ORYZ|nr:hypothetical protein E2562_035707 [Oryza meyeriana var. granulata]